MLKPGPHSLVSLPYMLLIAFPETTPLHHFVGAVYGVSREDDASLQRATILKADQQMRAVVSLEAASISPGRSERRSPTYEAGRAVVMRILQVEIAVGFLRLTF